MTNDDFHARRTELANAMAAAGAELLDFMGAAGALAAIPNTTGYVVAGDPRAIRAQLDTLDPQRRMRHGDRPTEPLYFGPETGQPRRWAALITSAGHGVLQEYGTRFEHAQPGQEVLEVMEILPGIANKAAEEGELSAACAKCNGTGMVDDGEIDCYPNGEPYSNGPVKCVKDCPECTSIAADRAARAGASEDARDAALEEALSAIGGVLWEFENKIGMQDETYGAERCKDAIRALKGRPAISHSGEGAAQAGQVAVPKHWQLVPKDLTDEMYAVVKEVAPRWNAASVWANILDAAPSPAKESK